MRAVTISLGLAVALTACISAPPPAERHDASAAEDASVGDGSAGDAGPADATGPDARTPCNDPDNDGYIGAGEPCSNGLPIDCEPGNNAVHPGALDLCQNNVDDDCSNTTNPTDAGVGPDAEPAQDAAIGQDAAPAPAPGNLACRADQPTQPELRPNHISSASEGTWFSNQYSNGHFAADKGYSLEYLFPSAAAPPAGVDTSGEDNGSSLLLESDTAVERLAGTMLWSNFSSTYTTLALLTPSVLASGGAVYRQRVDWEAAPAPGATGRVFGITYYTITPNGRLHRYESITVGPGVDAGENAYLTAYVAFDPEMITTLDWSWRPAAAYVLPSPFTGLHFVAEGPETQRGVTCAYHATTNARIGFSWSVPSVQPSPVGGPRISHTSMDGPEVHAALQFDWVRGDTVMPGTYTGSFMMVTQLNNADDRCASLASHVDGFQHPSTLAPLDSATVIITDSVGDDDGDGYNQGGGFYALSYAGTTGPTAHRTLDFTVDSGTPRVGAALTTSLFRLQGLPSTDKSPVVWFNGDLLNHGDHYLYQNEQAASPGAVWLYIKPLLVHGDRITITFPSGE